jgi:hypothetical protein
MSTHLKMQVISGSPGTPISRLAWRTPSAAADEGAATGQFPMKGSKSKTPAFKNRRLGNPTIQNSSKPGPSVLSDFFFVRLSS